MLLRSLRIENYKSFRSSGDIVLTPGFNVVVGRNNVGKTALLEAASGRFAPHPHRSLETSPSATTRVDPYSSVTVQVELSAEELYDLLLNTDPQWFVPFHAGQDGTESFARFRAAVQRPGPQTLTCVYRDGSLLRAALDGYGEHPGASMLLIVHAAAGAAMELSLGSVTPAGGQTDYGARFAQLLHERIYTFRAERLNVGETGFGPNSVLAPNASNLAEVLNILQGDAARFDRYNDAMRAVFPDIHRVAIRPSTTVGSSVEIRLWPVDPATMRADLTVPLAESGTGIGQVLAMLYVVLTADVPRVIIIDEPQSFLHPGAVRTLFEILRQYPQHQFVVTTHSPTAVTAANPSTLLLLRKAGTETRVERIDVRETQALSAFLGEVGARLSDVFGADRILWVEGKTEELCFPLVARALGTTPLLDTAILGVLHTGDFEGRHPHTAFEIYRRLSVGRGLLPPAVGFVFDREGRSRRERDDLARLGGGRVHFTPRRMYENYLLNPAAIAAVANGIDGFRPEPLTADSVASWIAARRWERPYLSRPPAADARTDATWLADVHGARLLDDAFAELSEGRARYDKAVHSVALTEWLLAHARGDLAEVATLIDAALVRPM